MSLADDLEHSLKTFPRLAPCSFRRTGTHTRIENRPGFARTVASLTVRSSSSGYEVEMSQSARPAALQRSPTFSQMIQTIRFSVSIYQG